MNTYTSIDQIIQVLRKQETDILLFIKVDGITIGCCVQQNTKPDKAILQLKQIHKQLNLPSYVTEINKEEPNKFLIQFPDLQPKFTQEELIKIYNSIFNWILNNYLDNCKDKNTPRQVFLDNRQIITKQAITIFYKSNTNRYKTHIGDYLNNIEYRNKVYKIYYQFLSSYKYKEKE